MLKRDTKSGQLPSFVGLVLDVTGLVGLCVGGTATGSGSFCKALTAANICGTDSGTKDAKHTERIS